MPIKPIRTFTVTPVLPPALEPLRALAYNLHWAWDHDTIELFRRLDSDLWETTNHNPVLMLGVIEQTKLEAAAQDDSFLAHLERASADLQKYLDHEQGTWFSRTYGAVDGPRIAYFSAEFGVTECLSIFAGGLGVLAGDHLKSASDLGLPLVGVGLLYQQGYFRQYLNQAGWQQEAYEDNDFLNLPLTLVRQAGKPLLVETPHPGRVVWAQVWRAQVGRVPLYLLDTNIEQNQPQDRDITDQLYGGDNEMRLRQELVLGIGGYRALQALDIHADVYHINEGHSAFLALERVRRIMARHEAPFAVAREAAATGLVFTTHTPVSAGQDYFPPQLLERYLGNYVRELGLPFNDFLALGRQSPYDNNEAFCMTVLALRMATYSNGVSRLHGEVAREMWRSLWPNVPLGEVPITHVTNGVHFQSWISRDMKQLYDRYLGPRWSEEPADAAVWRRVERIAPEELWRTHERRRERMVAFVRNRLRVQLRQRGASGQEIADADEVLNPEALTIGFARRFATYKRATLLMRDIDRLAAILNAADQPVQIIFAGKAHPRDDPGKALIQQIANLARQERFRHHLVFLEDYDMSVSRYLVQGVDVWLNTPRRPREASGTSGMKAAANGVLNLSILDGWWDEAYTPGVGWAIGAGEAYVDPAYQDAVEAEALYNLLEREVVPMFYERGNDGLPRRWLDHIKTSIASLCSFFNTHRMVSEYATRFYMPLAARHGEMMADGLARARALALWRQRVQVGWNQVRVEAVEAGEAEVLRMGEALPVQARIFLGDLKPADVTVALYMGLVDAQGELVEAQTRPIEMQLAQQLDPRRYLFQAEALPAQNSGRHGFTVRVLPHHADLPTSFLPGLIVWA